MVKGNDTANKNKKGRYNLRDKKNKDSEEKSKLKKGSKGPDSDDDDSSEEDFDHKEYQKFLGKMFPSKHMQKQIEEHNEADKKMDKSNRPDKDKKEKDKKPDIDKKEKDKKEKDKKPDRDKKDNDKKETKKSNKVNEEEENKKTKEKSKKKSKKNPKKKSKQKSDTESDSDSENYSDDSSSSNDSDDEVHMLQNSMLGGKCNIILTLGDMDMEEDDSDDSDYKTSDETSGSDSSSDDEDELVEMFEVMVRNNASDYESESDTDDDDSDESDNDNKKSKRKKGKKCKKSKDDDEDSDDDTKTRGKDNKAKDEDMKDKAVKDKAVKDKETNDKETNDKPSKKMGDMEILNKFKELSNELKKTAKSKELLGGIDKKLTDSISKQKKIDKKKDKKQKDKNFKKFQKLAKEQNVINDYKYFKKITVDEQRDVISKLNDVIKITKVSKPYRMTLLDSEIPDEYKAHAFKKINSLKYMGPSDGEYYKIKTWVDTFMQIPFNKYKTLDITMDDGVDKCHDFMDNAKKCLDEAAFGLDDAKMQIMQLFGQLISNPKAVGTAIAIKGPMGTGKTTLVKEGISKILQRPFAFIPLGGATDSSFLEGHSYTYEGSLWGKIVDILIQSKCMNPVFYFDELDKVSDTAKGEEIIGILTHLTDTSQNNQFHDKYFSEIDFDLSRALFIFSYNDEERINPILRDRMYKITTKGYNIKEKTTICSDYLSPKIQENVGFKKDDIIIPDDVIKYIIDNYTDEEKGVRNIKRCIEIIYTKLNLYRLMKPDTNLFKKDLSIKVEFPYTVTTDVVQKLIKKEEKVSLSHLYL
jgi:ATP-dependent Lon protease